MSSVGNSKFVEVMSKILRPLNFVGGIGTIAVGVLVLIVGGATFRTLLNLMFTTVLGLLLLAGEFNLQVINNNCKFLATFLGRGFYDIFVGGWIFGLHSYFWIHDNPLRDIGYIVSLVVSISLWVLGAFFIAMHFFASGKYIYEVQPRGEAF